MCGIASIFAYHSSAPSIGRSELRQIRDYMTPRGPDGAGEWFSGDERIAMGHRRLSIIDLSEEAAQPMQTGDGSLVISFNGEIYNYKELRAQLVSKGYTFKSQSDTEVLLHLYRQKGEAMIHDLRGMFAFALWDAKKHTMLLVRDLYGIKPLYYADDGNTVRIASQVKALLAGGKISTEPDPAGIVGFFLTGSVPEPFTTYRQIRQVPAGSLVRIDPSGPSKPEHYNSIARIFSEANSKKAKTSQDQVREALAQSLTAHLVSDVPVGAFLSGGIDSGALVGLAHDLGINIPTVTIGFEEFQSGPNDEVPLAKQVASFYGFENHTRIFTQSEFKNGLEHFFQAMDQPSIDGLNSYFAAQAAKEIGLKVMLSGLGGDELFGGYPSFHSVPASVRTFGIPSRIPFLGEMFRRTHSSWNIFSDSHPKLGGLIQLGGTCAGAYFLQRGLFMPWELESVLEPEMVQNGLNELAPLELVQESMKPDPKNWFGRIATLESSNYMRNQLLRDADWAGMAHSIEMRIPLVDIQLLKTLAPVLLNSRFEHKSLLTNSLRTPLPMNILKRPKHGFSVPVEGWLGTEKGINQWLDVPALTRQTCPWARRWAYVVMQRQDVGIPETAFV